MLVYCLSSQMHDWQRNTPTTKINLVWKRVCLVLGYFLSFIVKCFVHLHQFVVTNIGKINWKMCYYVFSLEKVSGLIVSLNGLVNVPIMS